MSAYVTHAETPGRQFAYISNINDNTVSVIDTSTNTVTDNVSVGNSPRGVAVNPAGTKVYVANQGSDSVSIIDTSTNTVTDNVSVESGPDGVAVTPDGTKAYVANMFSDSVSVIDTTTNTVTATVTVGYTPIGVAVNPAGTKVYVASQNSKSIYVIDTSTNTVTDTVTVGNLPTGVTVNPTGTKVYVTDYNSNSVSVIDTSTNTVIASVTVGLNPYGVAVNPTGTKVYVTDYNSNSVSVIDTSTNTVTDTVTVGNLPTGVTVNPTGTKVYVANQGSDNVSVIDTTTNTVTDTVSAGSGPIAFGQFMIPSLASEPVLPVTNFSSNVSSGYVPLSVQFNDSSLNATGWNWDFGDGFNSTEQNPSHVYVSSGSYTVNLTVTNTAGTNTSSRAGYILVSSPVPTAAFNGTPTSGTVPMNVTFTDLSTGSPTGWAWFFGDEPYTQTWTQMNASSGWPARICYSSIVLPDGSIVLMGGWDETNKLNDVWRSTNKGATWTKVSNAGWSARAHHSSVVLPDGSIVLMGGSDSTSSRNDTWQSTDKGITWTLVNASSGWTGRYYHSSVALPDGSIVLMGGSDDATWRNDTWRSEDKGATWKRMNESAGWTGRIFHSSASLPDGSIILTGGLDGTARLNDTWLSEDKGATWTLINGSSGWMGRTSHSSVAMPDGSVLLMGGLGIDNTPLHDIWRSTDKGRTWTKVADAGWSGRYYHNVVALSDGSIVLMGGLDDTTLLNDTWRLQPAGSNDPNPTHTYTAPGTYKVTLQAFNAGGYNSTCKTGYVTVTQSSPTAAFNGTPISGTEPLTVTFADRSTGEPTTWFWDFGDGTNSTEQHPSHTYTSAGNYTVILKVSNSAGNDTLSRAGYVLVLPAPVLPVVNFSANVTSGYTPLSVQFTDSSLNATGWNWDFGDGFNSTEQNPAHTYSIAGNYTVNLTVSNLNGTDSKLATITVSEKPVLPVANFSSNVTNGYAPLSVQFTDLSENTTGLNWDFGDSFNSTEQNPVHTYSTAGNYTVNLTASNLNGTDSKLATITVSAQPVLPYHFVTKWGSSGSSNGMFSSPYGVSVDSSGNVYVADTNNHRIQKFDSSGNFLITWGSSGSGNGNFSRPRDVAVDAFGNIYVADTDNNRIQKFDSSGNFITTWGSIGSGNGMFSSPYGVSVDSSGNVYVADTSNGRIQKFDSNGNFITAWGSYGSNNGSFIYPTGVSVDPSGNVYVGDTNNNRIQKFDSSGNFISTWGSYGSGNGSFKFPYGVSIDSSGNVYVADTFNHRIQKFDSNGNFLITWGSPGNDNGSFIYPYDVSSDSSDTVYVADTDNNRIQKFSTLVFPVANFSSNVTSGYAPLSVQFNDSSENATGWKWDFEDGFNSTERNPVHTYSIAGNYTVNLTVSNENGTNSTFATITVLEYNPAYSIDKIVTDVAGKGPVANVTGAGDVISYQINVTNEGNIDLTNITVTDHLIANITGPYGDESQTGILNVGEKWTFTGTYTVTQDDMNSNGDGDGFINNTATVDFAELDQVTDSASVTIEQIPDYRIDKIVTDVAGKGPAANVTGAGDVISYQINVTNDGNVDLTNVNVTDHLIANITGPYGDDYQTGILNVGEKWTFTGTYTVTQADLNNNGGGDGFINNTAIVDCDQLNRATDSVEVPVEQIPDYRIDKIVTDVAGKGPAANLTGAGDVISYQINVTNDGNVDLTNINVTDPLIGDITGPYGDDYQTGILNAGEKWTFTGTYTVTQDDLNNNGGGDGFINNTATVDCEQLNQETDSAEVPVEQIPDYSIDKIVTDVAGKGSSANVTGAGEVISYQINVTNNGNIDLSNITVNDPLTGNLTGPEGDDSQTGILNVGEKWTFTGTYTVTQDDLNSNGGGDGFINNTATVDCAELDQVTDSASVTIEQIPDYSIDKIVTDIAGKGPAANVTGAGEVINYQINVTNDGNIDLSNITVNDPLVGNLTGPSGDDSQTGILNVGEKWTFTGTYTVTQDDLNSNGDGDGFINNTATVDCDQLDPENDSEAVPITRSPDYTIDKTVTDLCGSGPSANVNSAGDIISYQIRVNNTGNVDLTNVNVNDPLLKNLTGPLESVNANGVLEVGENWTYTGAYTVTQADLNNNGDGDGFINNTATVDCDQLGPENDSAAVQIIRSPGYTIDKTVTDVCGKGPAANVTSAGDVISYQIKVENNGNVDLTNVSVNDPLLGDFTGPLECLNADGILEVRESWIYRGTYTVTQDDLNSNGDGDGFINNTATVDCAELNPKSDSAAVSIEQKPACKINKIVIDVAGNGPEGRICSAGDVVSFQVNVTNNGNIDLKNISVRDSMLNLRGPYGDTGLVGLYQSSLTRYTNGGDGILSVGEAWYYLGNYTVTQEDLNNNGGGDGFLNSTVTFDSSETEPINETTIHYVDESGNESENESSGIRIEQNPDYSIYKSVIEVENGKDGVADNAGDVIRYRILVKNEGNVDLTGVSVNDQMITLEDPLESKAADRVLEVGENWTYTGNYTVTQEDINSNGGGDGYIDNTATVSCNELSNKNSSVKVLLPAAEISGGRSGHGSGTGSARIVSDTSENVDVNRTSTEENETQIQFEEETEYVEKETGNETAKPQTNEEIKSKIAPVMKMIYGIAFLLIACLLIVFMYKRRQEEQK